MAAADLSALLLTTEPEFRYFTGFLTRFWASPTRPWFLVIPAAGEPVAVIPTIGEAVLRRGWLQDVRTWPSPRPSDEGISLTAEALWAIAGATGRIGVPSGAESRLGLPLADWARLQHLVGRRLEDDAGILRSLRLVKSPAEIAKIGEACAIAGRAFARLPEVAGTSIGLDAVFRGFQSLCLQEGADWIGYLAGAAGQGGYDDVISPAAPTPLEAGDVLMLDTGAVFDGYYCDYDRNVAIGHVAPGIVEGHARLIEAIEAGAIAARPGATAGALFDAMAPVLGVTESGAVGRLGHGLGMSLTEWPSILPGEETVLVPGIVLTLEPAIILSSGRMMVHEENIVIEETGCRFLSPRVTGPIEVLA